MANQYFQFKQFNVNQSLAAMKVGTDGVLLGAWFDGCGCKTILDIGTGTGLLALMAAQRFQDAVVHAIDIDEDAAIQARENLNASPWAKRLTVECTSFQDYCVRHIGRFDHVVCNPPYFVQSLKAPDKARSLARHDDGLSFSDLAMGIATVLNPNGKATVILPPLEMAQLVELMRMQGYFAVRQLYVLPLPDKSVKRIITEFSRVAADISITELVVEAYGRHGYSEEYKQLTREFLLAF